jgi:DNA invertase Pin-like site-specific DNA recombinase
MQTFEKYIAYYRVSTTKQGVSGLGLEAQKESVKRFVGDNYLLYEFIEVESGKKANRQELQKAIQECIKLDATLVIAKLDRLSRNVLFMAKLMESKVKFKCVDNPQADNFTIHLLTAFAQKEAEMISLRTKAALKAKRDRGEKIFRKTAPKGSKRAREIARMGGKARIYEVTPEKRQLIELVKLYHEKGMSTKEVMSELEKLGYNYPFGTIANLKTKIKKELKSKTKIK